MLVDNRASYTYDQLERHTPRPNGPLRTSVSENGQCLDVHFRQTTQISEEAWT